MSESNGDEFNVESSESSENPDDAMMNQMLEKIRSGLKNNPNSELNPEKNRMLQVITILIMIMAAVTGAVSQEITGIQDDAASKEAEAQDMFATARALESSENQILLREEILMTEAQSQAALSAAILSEKSSIEADIEELDDVYYLSALRSEIDTYYLRGNELFRMEWSEGLLIDTCYTGTDTGLHSQCQADLVAFEGTDVVNDAVEISFTFDESLGDDASFNKMISYLRILEYEYDGFYKPYILSNDDDYYVQIQFPLWYGGSEVYEWGDGLMWQNKGMQFNLEWTNGEILDIQYDIDVCETYGDYYDGWASTHKNNAASAERIWLTNQQIADTYYANGNTSMGDNVSEQADWWHEERNRLMNLSNENKSVAHEWDTMLYENTTLLDTYQAWYDSELVYLNTALSDLEKSIVGTENLIIRYAELSSRANLLEQEIEFSTELKLSLSADTVAYQMGYLSIEDAKFTSNESRIAFENTIHNESDSMYILATASQQEGVSIREGLESITLSILLISMGNVLFGASGGMMQEKRLGYKGSNRNVLIVFACGCLSSIFGILMFIIA
jgi:hypothetical protein